MYAKLHFLRLSIQSGKIFNIIFFRTTKESPALSSAALKRRTSFERECHLLTVKVTMWENCTFT